MHVLAHLSDPHLDGTPEPRRRMADAVAALRRSPLPIDAVILTGDVGEGGAPGIADVVRELLDDGPPWIAAPGNSDIREGFAAGAGGQAASEGRLDGVLDLDGLRIVLLDSLLPGEISGALAPASTTFLRDRLAERPGTPAVVGWHHPPVELGHAQVDALRLRDPGPVEEVVAAAPDVVAVLVGHAHAAVASTFAGRPLLVAPGLHSQLVPPFEPRAADQPLIDEGQPPGFAVHVIHDDRRVSTWFRLLQGG